MTFGRPPEGRRGVSRRAVLAGAAGTAATGMFALAGCDGRTQTRPAAPRLRRGPDTVPSPRRAAGEHDPGIPIDHVVVVMMENHSFDNYFGMLPRRGQRRADGFWFDRGGRPTNSNRALDGRDVRAFHLPTLCQPANEPDQSWRATHLALAGGRMSGFVRASGDVAMGYWDESDLPFYYALARSFALADRWFASVPAQSFANRRFLHAASAWGLTASVLPSRHDRRPPHGTIFDRLDAYGISWADYYTDVPQVALIPSVARANPHRLKPMFSFFADCAAGTLPAYSLVDPKISWSQAVAGESRVDGDDEENPQNVGYGEQFVAEVVRAVIASPAWPRTLLVWLYDEHGGYYDHVPPPPAPAPDRIAPRLRPGDPVGGYDRYGVRVPAVVVSPWARAGRVSSVVHDHTSVLAFVERLWNLPAMTHRDANAADLLDLLDFRRPALLEPPALPAPPAPRGGRTCR